MYINHKVNFIDKTSKDKKDSFYCPMCYYPLISFKDFNSFEEYAVCNKCFLQFAESRKKEWKDGWRPSKKAIKEYIYLRNQINKIHLK